MNFIDYFSKFNSTEAEFSLNLIDLFHQAEVIFKEKEIREIEEKHRMV